MVFRDSAIFGILTDPLQPAGTMPKQRTQTGLVLAPRAEGAPAGRWLYDALREAILDGRLRTGARLPATRALATQYGLSRGTIVNVFEQLASEGYVEARVGSGTRVRCVLPDRLLQVVRTPQAQTTPTPPRRLSSFARQAQPLRRLNTGPARAFRANEPALELFPTTLWAQVAGRRLRRASMALLSGCGPLGYEPLQAQVAEYLTTSRGVRCSPEQIAIVAGGQAGLDLLARMFVEPGDCVAIEEPGYPGARRLFKAYGARLQNVPVDGEGIVVDELRRRRARVVYVTPAHHFPLGMSMSLARRLDLLDWARRTDSVILEDDYDSEYRFAGRPLPALQGLDPGGCVVLTGTFSKVLFPALRLGYVVVPADLVETVSAILSIVPRHAQVLDQAVLADFMEAGHFGRHVRRMREVYAERLRALLDAATDRLAGLLDVSGVEAGLQTVGWLPEGVDAVRVAQSAARHSVQVNPLGWFAETPLQRDGLQLGFAAVDEREIRRGVDVLRTVITDELRAARR